MQRHIGGVRGTRLLRAQCPECDRSISGGRMFSGRRDHPHAGKIRLRDHHAPSGGPCPGSGRLMTGQVAG